MKTIKFTITALCLLLVSLAYGQQSYFCTTFEDGSFDGWQNFNVSSSIENPSLDGNNYLQLHDESNGSWGYNSTSYPDNWEELIGSCLCFDYKVFNDGHLDIISNVHPVIAIYNGSTPMNSTMIASFSGNITITENDGWVHVCAPISFSSGDILPSNGDGNWNNFSGVQTSADWNALLSNVGGITFGTDIAGSGAQTEIIGVDNICIEDCSNVLTPSNEGAYCCDSINLITNGNFEDAINLDFISDYADNPAVYPGNFSVASSAAPFNANVSDHSFCTDQLLYPSNDQFLLVNGHTQQSGGNSTAVIWEHVLSDLDTNSTYKFCANFKNMLQCTFDILPIVSIEANGIGIGSSTTISTDATDPCDWTLVSENFSTGQNTSVTLQIILDQTGNGDGNDLAIDDISVSKLIDPELSITVQHQGSPDHIVASVNTIDVVDDGLHCSDSLYEWGVAEVFNYAPGNIVTSQILWKPAPFWALTTTFPTYSFDPTKMYMIVLRTPTCGCYDEGYTFQLTYNFRPMAIQMTPEQELSIIESIRNGTISNGEAISATGELNEGFDDLILYPNPVENSFSISLKGNSLKTVEVLSLTGQVLLSKNYSDAKAEEILDISQLASGIYLIKVFGIDNTQYTTKVVKE